MNIDGCGEQAVEVCHPLQLPGQASIDQKIEVCPTLTPSSSMQRTT
jgi:hypothetical protein